MGLRKKTDVANGPTRFRPVCLEPDRRGERLVGIGFRCWLAGYDTCDIACWETGWNYFTRELGPNHAKHAVGELACWVRALRETAGRKLNYYPFGCAGFCRDECLAISMVAASQHQACPALKACAFALLGASPVDAAVEKAADFAYALDEAGIHLDGRSVMQADTLLEPSRDGPPH